MIVKRFSGRTAEEALAIAKWEMGEDAIVLSSGQARDRWWKVWQTGFQVLVATDLPRGRARENQTGIDQAAPTRAADTWATVPLPGDLPWQKLLDTLTGIERRLDRIGGQEDSRANAVTQWFVDRHIAEPWARQLASLVEVGEGQDIAQAAMAPLVQALPPPAPISLAEPGSVVFVGPTGSGKTTTIAKLAAYFRLQKERSVLLISCDTFRVAAVEQLKTYAEILGVPFKVALRPQEVADARRDVPADVTLIDTAGHSLHQALYLAEIRSIVEAAQAKDVEVVLPATMDPRLLVDTAQKFGQGLPAKLCLTKLDEALMGGGLVTAILELGWPVSYLTDGQGVPDDIQVAFPETLAQWVVKGGPFHG